MTKAMFVGRLSCDCEAPPEDQRAEDVRGRLDRIGDERVRVTDNARDKLGRLGAHC